MVSRCSTFAILIALLGALPMRAAYAQVVTPLHSFTGSDGAFPVAGLCVGPDSAFYGTTIDGGAHGTGAIFRITKLGAFATLYSFSPVGAGSVNGDGAYP